MHDNGRSSAFAVAELRLLELVQERLTQARAELIWVERAAATLDDEELAERVALVRLSLLDAADQARQLSYPPLEAAE